jgi:site-specific recombinase XerD
MKLFEQVHQACRTKHYSPRTEAAYTRWIERFLRFHRETAGEWVHPRNMRSHDVEAFLTHLAVHRHVSASTQNQALNALVFLFRDVVKKELREFDAVRAKRPRHRYRTHPPRQLCSGSFASESTLIATAPLLSRADRRGRVQ